MCTSETEPRLSVWPCMTPFKKSWRNCSQYAYAIYTVYMYSMWQYKLYFPCSFHDRFVRRHERRKNTQEKRSHERISRGWSSVFLTRDRVYQSRSAWLCLTRRSLARHTRSAWLCLTRRSLARHTRSAWFCLTRRSLALHTRSAWLCLTRRSLARHTR